MKPEIEQRSETSSILKNGQELMNHDISLWATENAHMKTHPNIGVRPASPASWWARTASDYQAWIDAGGFFQGEEDVCDEPKLDREMMADDPGTQAFFCATTAIINKVKPE